MGINLTANRVAQLKPARDIKRSRQRKVAAVGNIDASVATRNTLTDHHETYTVVSQIQNYVQHIKRKLEFTIDDETGESIVQVHDKESGEIIRQLSASDLIDSAHITKNNAKGLLIKTKV